MVVKKDLMTIEQERASLISKLISEQDENGCWNKLNPGDKYYPYFQYYCPNFKSTLWTLIFLADIECRGRIEDFKKPLRIISDNFYDAENGIYTIGKSHFPIPCLNGNMLYLHSYFGFEDEERVSGIIDFFAEYQRFDDGDYRTPPDYPYFSNRSCYGKHSCYWGVVRLLKGLSFIPAEKRSANAVRLLQRCIDFVLLHEVCFSSHDNERFLQPHIGKLGFPNMYKADFLELLWLLKREGVADRRMSKAIELLKSRQLPDGSWKSERPPPKLAVPFPPRRFADSFITERANYMLNI